jgi:hypothetical protein
MTLKPFLILLIFFWQSFSFAQSDWHEKESAHFKVIYRTEHSFLINHILNSAEKSLDLLSKLFDYTPSEKIIINTYDIYDYGFASATTVPENFIRLEIEPFEPGYENILYNDRFQWIISHELVHIVLNDQASGFESFSRSIFSKVLPEQIQPLTVLYSLLSNYSRYTGRWHQESSAVFLETWMSGGFGRALGSFDEMYFRSLVYEGKKFPSDVELEARTTHNSFQLESLFYTYGGRFSSYLALNFSSDKLLKWYKVNKSEFYRSYKSKFREAFGKDFDDEWDNFVKSEVKFQVNNIRQISFAPLTEIKPLTRKPVGWVTDAYIYKDEVIFGIHGSGQLAGIFRLNINDKNSLSEITTLTSPSMYQVASVAFDSVRNFIFYTTNNNQLYRDVWVYDNSNGDKKELFPDMRIGHMSVCSATGEFWGIQHSLGKTRIILSQYPYNEIHTLYSPPIPDEIIDINVSPNGRNLAAVIHNASGINKLVVLNADDLKSGTYKEHLITADGSPENPSWSADGEYLLWNSYINGVSNIYRVQNSSSKIEALTNSVRGLFRPVMLNDDSLFVFEFTSEGFIPSLVAVTPAEKLPAIKYLGQMVFEANTHLASYSLPDTPDTIAAAGFKKEKDYNGLLNLKLQAFIPVITGFQNQKVLGVYTRIADPLLNHDLTAELGYSPFGENPEGPEFHLKLKYEYLKRIELGIDYNAADFYDLFNKRKRSTIGTKIKAGYTHYWLYDNPHKIKHTTELALYTDFQYINDNLVRVTEPDFSVLQSVWNSKNLRRSIGSSDYEKGDDITATVMMFGVDPEDPQLAAELHLEWDKFTTFAAPHNVFHYKIAAGYHHANERLGQALFYFGGFGNREIENTDVKQYRSVFRFPGIPIYSLPAEQFAKLLLENNFPPIRFSNASIGQHYLNHIDIAVYSQSLLLKTFRDDIWINAGAQINFIFKHWFNLESTFSGGIAKAWSKNTKDWEWFLSYKLLKN